MDGILNVLTVIGSALFMIVFFGLCIIVHEFGHFLAARLCGLHVIAFSVGFRKIWCKKINGVEYRIGWIPCGGYVDLPQIDASGEAKDENGNVLPKAEPWKRIVTAFAGPFFNVIFGLILGCFIWYFGVPQDTPRLSEIKVRQLEAESPEYKAGLRNNDVIFKLNGSEFHSTWSEFVRDVMLTVGDVRLSVRRDGKNFEVAYKPAINKSVAPREEIPYPFFKPEIPVVLYPMKGKAADKAGLKPGDRVLAVNGREISDDNDFIQAIEFSNGKPLAMKVRRDGKNIDVTVLPVPAENEQPAWMIGISFKSANGVPEVKTLISGLPAEKVLKPGDRILALNGKKIPASEFSKNVTAEQGKPVVLLVERNGKQETLHLAAVKVVPHVIGVSFYFLNHPTPFRQLLNVITLTGRSLRSLSAGIRNRLGFEAGYTAIGPQHLSGPAGIGRVLYLSVYKGSIMVGLNVVVVITFSLGLFNLLPIPVLDGGHILLALLEIIFRRPVPAKVLQPVSYFFAGILILFMIYVTFYDVKKMMPESVLKKLESSASEAPAQNVVDSPKK